MSHKTTHSRLEQINFGSGQLITEAFTRQHYIAIAAVIAGYKGDKTARGIAHGLASLFSHDNAAFDEARFLEACGIE